MKKYFTPVLYLCMISILFFACKEKKLPEQKSLNFELVRTISLKVQEPSGLDLTFNRDGFWTVSDENSKVYLLDPAGNVLRSFKVNGIDLEGVAVVNENTIAVVLERSREIVLLDTLGNEIGRKKLNLAGESNSGLEGITYDVLNNKYYLINEKSPGLLIKLDKELNEQSRTELKLAKDYSGIFYEKNENVLWILSDESQKIIITDNSGNLIEEYSTKIVQAEGITLDYEKNRCYIVSDNKEELYEYRIVR